MRTGSDAMAPSSAARWEIDLSGGAGSSPESPRAGSKRIFMEHPSCPRSRPRHGEAEVGDQLLRPRCTIVAGDPQRDDALAVVLRGRERHVDDVDARAAERKRDLRD